MSVKFGTSGLRGLATDLIAGEAIRYTCAFVRHLAAIGEIEPGNEILVGRDLRQSSPDLARACMEGLAGEGMRPIDCGEVATPALALLALQRRIAAVMVTGSHIPADRNGLKFYRPGGEIDKKDEEAIAAIAAEDRLSRPGDAIKALSSREAADLFRQRYFSLSASFQLTGLRIGLYEHSSVLRDFLRDLLGWLGAEVVPFGRSASFVPIDTEALEPESINRLRDMSRRLRLDAIVSTDADGDRPLVIDEQGNQVRGDVLGILASRLLGIQAIATPITSNSGIEAALDRAHVVRTKVGSPYVVEGMRRLVADGSPVVAGFEANGGFLLGTPASVDGVTLDPLPTRDSVLPLLAVLREVGRTGKRLSELVHSLGLPVSIGDRIKDFPVETSARLIGWLQSDPDHFGRFVQAEIARIDETDGLRGYLASGEVIHLRASGNAPEMRCYVEMRGEEKANELLRKTLDRLEKWREYS